VDNVSTCEVVRYQLSSTIGPVRGWRWPAPAVQPRPCRRRPRPCI